MCISNREQLRKAINNLDEEKHLQKSLLLGHFQLIQQSADPVFLLKRRLSQNKPDVPHLFNNLIDQTFFSASEIVRNKIGLNRSSFITNAADNFLQKIFNRIFADNHLKIKAIVLATAKNLFR